LPRLQCWQCWWSSIACTIPQTAHSSSAFRRACPISPSARRNSRSVTSPIGWQDPVYSILEQWPGGLYYNLSNFSGIPTGAILLSMALPGTVGGPLLIDASQLTVANQGISTVYIANQAINALQVGIGAITAANQGLDNLSVIDANVASANVSKLVSGTLLTDLYFSRGTLYPQVAIDSTGIYLYSVSTSGTAAPYTVVQSTGVYSYTTSTGASTALVAGGIALYSVNGTTSSPYMNLSSTGLNVSMGGTGAEVSLSSTYLNLYSVAGNTADPYVSIQSSGLGIYQSSTNYVTLNSSGINLTSGSFVTTIVSSGIQMKYGSTGPIMNLTSGYLNFVSGNFRAEASRAHPLARRQSQVRV
jgi:hypothetical protein